MYSIHRILIAVLLCWSCGLKYGVVVAQLPPPPRALLPAEKESGPNKLDRGAAKRSMKTTTTTKRVRTTPERISQKEDCDYLAHYCLKAYRTGRICGRTLYYRYQSFSNYCLLDYVNCKEGYEVWQIVHMGECFNLDKVKNYKHYVYDDDSFLDQIYIMDDW